VIRIKEWDNVEVRNLASDCVDYVRVVDGKEETYAVITLEWQIPTGYHNAMRDHTFKVLVPQALEEKMEQPYLRTGSFIDYNMPTKFIATEVVGERATIKEMKEMLLQTEKLQAANKALLIALKSAKDKLAARRRVFGLFG
jgi:hypothetical protein